MYKQAHFITFTCMLYAIVLTHLNCQRNYPNQNKKILKLSRFYLQMRIIKFYLLISILICRVLKKHMPFFTKFGSGVERHIWHTHSEEMSQKSDIVSTYMNVCYL